MNIQKKLGIISGLGLLTMAGWTSIGQTRPPARATYSFTEVAIAANAGPDQGPYFSVIPPNAPADPDVGSKLFITAHLHQGITPVPGTFPVRFPISNADLGALKGIQTGVCTTVSVAVQTPFDPGESIARCEHTYQLPGGTIEVSGTFNNVDWESGKPATLAVVGGTDRFENARGKVVVRSISTNICHPNACASRERGCCGPAGFRKSVEFFLQGVGSHDD